jgi:type I restriction enzyme S subunit
MRKSKNNNNNLPKGWRKVKLGEIADISYGKDLPTRKLKPAGFPVYGGNGIIGYSDEYLFEDPKIIIGCRGAYSGNIFRTKPKSFVTHNSLILNFKDKTIDESFIFYKLLCSNVKSTITGSAQPQITITELEQLELDLPSSEEQKRIADILSAFDDKIELNNKIIKTLEEMAQEIFKEWFIKFRFPGWEKIKFVDSELGKIPEGWEVKNIMEIVKRIPVGKRYDNKTALPKGKVPILDQGQSGIIGFHNEEPGVKASPQNPVAVFSNHTCYYRLVTFDFSCIQNVIPYIGINGYPTTFVFYLTKDKIKMSDYKGHWPEFTAQKFIVPPPELAAKFNETIQPMIEKIDEIRKENQKLAELRDLLLPKLMSGEIRV